MKHWHECRICKEYFECGCDDPTNLGVACDDCKRVRRETVSVDSVIRELLRRAATDN